jgi:gliding motility-associated transport system permease protein
MEQTVRIFRKEFRSYFASPIAYIVISIFLIISGWFFFSTFFLYGQAEMRGFFALLPFTCAFIVPAVTMRLFSEEFNTGSFELLLTLPVSHRDIVLGKFLAATAFSAMMLLPTLSYAASVALLGDLDWGPVVGGYAGAILLCAAFSAIGVFASSLTRNQIISFIVAMTACVVLTLLDKLLVFVPEPLVGLFQFLGADAHFQSIARGILDSRDVLYFLSICFVALSGTMIAIKERS